MNSIFNQPDDDPTPEASSRDALPLSILNAEPPRKSRKGWLVLLILIVLVPVLLYGWNYIALQRPMNDVIEHDPRNKGIEVSVHYKTYVNPSVLVYDLTAIAGTNSKIDVFRSFLQFADKMKEYKFAKVELAFKGKTKFVLEGDYFQQLGREYGLQNPVYTMNHFPENLRLPDGTRAYETWTGGWLGVAGRQIEDFNDFHDKWYVREILMH